MWRRSGGVDPGWGAEGPLTLPDHARPDATAPSTSRATRRDVPAEARVGRRCPGCNKRAPRQLAGARLPRSVARAATKAVSAERSTPHAPDLAPPSPDLLHGEQRRRKDAGMDAGTGRRLGPRRDPARPPARYAAGSDPARGIARELNATRPVLGLGRRGRRQSADRARPAAARLRVVARHAQPRVAAAVSAVVKPPARGCPPREPRYAPGEGRGVDFTCNVPIRLPPVTTTSCGPSPERGSALRA